MSPKPRLVLILAVSALLRGLMVLQGGQYFFGDETRYDRGVQLYGAILRGEWTEARAILGLPEHALFTAVGAGVTAVQHRLALFTPYADWRHPENIMFTMTLGALVLSLFSTLNLYLVHRLARNAGADDSEALWVLLLAAASNVMFYPARHLLPYSCALSAALLALVVGLRKFSTGRALACGVMAGLCYHLYNGYWYLVPVIALGHAWWWRGETGRWRAIFIQAGGTAAGLLGPVAVGAWCGGAAYFHTMAAFSGTVTQGLFAEGWRLPWEYFWHAEGWLGVAVVLLVAGALASAPRPVPPRIKLWLILLGAAYGLLVLLSVGLERFVVYARTVLPFAPLFCLLGGWAIAMLLRERGRLQLAAGAGLVVIAGLQFAGHFNRVFPREIEIMVMKKYGVPKHSLSVTGSLYYPLGLPVTRPDLVLVNDQLLYPIRGELPEPVGRALLRFENALSYPPFQYESHTPAEREYIRTHDISIVLIQVAEPAVVPNDLPYAFRYHTADKPTGRERPAQK